MIRLQDIVDHHLQDTKRILDVSGPDFALESFLHLPVEVVSLRVDGGQTPEIARPNDLILDAVGSAVRENGFLTHIRMALDALPPDALSVFVVKDHLAELPLDDIAEIADSAGCQLMDAAQLAYPEWPAALVIGRYGPEHVHEASLAHLPAGAPAGYGVDSHRLGARLAGDAPDQVGRDRQRQEEEHEREREQRIALEKELAQLRSSIAMRVGSALVGTVRKPSSAHRLPIRLARIYTGWRRRGGRVFGPSLDQNGEPIVKVAETTPEPLKADDGHRFLAGFGAPATRTDSLEIWGVVTDAVAMALSEYASLSRLLPHEAKVALEVGTPDLVLIQAQSLMPPGPWGHAGTPGGAVSYTKALHDLVEVAQSRGVPVVVWQDVPPSFVPAFGPLGRLADFFIHGGDIAADGTSWSPGVPLVRFHPTEKTVTDRVLVYDEDAGRVFANAATRMRHGLERSGLATVCTAWTPDLHDLIRTHSVALASPFSAHEVSATSDFTLASLASGARIASGLNDGLLAAFPAAVFPVLGREDPDKAIQPVLDMPELSVADRRRTLRRIFDDHATPVRLARLVSGLGLAHDPLARRQVTALIRVADAGDLGPVLDSLLRQSTSPSRVVISSREISDRALDEVRALGIAASVAPADEPLSALAQLADTPWVTTWDASGFRSSTDLLKDLSVAAECSQADAVGILGDEHAVAAYGRYVNSLPSRRSLVRRDVLVRLGASQDLGVLADQGARLFGVNYTGATQ